MVVIETPDNPVGVINAVATVYEAGLGPRNGEPAGTGEMADGNANNNSDTREATSGTIVFDAPDGTKEVLINGVAVDHVGQTFTSPMGTMTITSIDLANGQIGFGYVLMDNVLNQTSDPFFQMTVVDKDGDQATATLTVNIVDDAPIAENDTDTVGDAQVAETGNVITGVGTTSGNAGVDRVGADNAVVSSVLHGSTTVNAANGTMVIAGDYGTLTLHGDGSYSYVQTAANPGSVNDQFTYTLTDGDGSTDTATLTIHIDDNPTTLHVPVAGDAGTQVLEAGLAGPPAGSAAAGDGEFTSGTITYTAPDAPAVVTINGTAVSAVGDQVAGAHGTLTITGFSNGTITYTYELTSHTSGDNTSDAFAVVVTDHDGDHSDATLTIAIVDDKPTAVADVDSVTEDGPLVADGNVLTGSGGTDANTSDGVADVAGADGAHVTAVAFGGTAGTVGTALAGAYGSLTLNADGSYSYALDNSNALVQGLDKTEHLTETFTYTITDGDGDPSTTTLTITINGADDGVTIGGLNPAGAEQTVFENDLADGSSPDAAALTKTGTFTVTAQDGVSTISVGGHVVYTSGAFVAGQTVATAYGTLTITGVTPTTTDAHGDVTAATVSYSYVLTDNTLTHTGANDVSLTDTFAITVTDTDGSTANDHLDVTVVDDTPTAHADADTVAAGSFAPEAGNVISGSGTTSGAAGADTVGADGARVSFGGTIVGGVLLAGSGHAISPGGSVVIHGQYGDLTLSDNGDYSYTRNTDTPGGVDDKFVYVLSDGDGDSSPTTLTISIDDSTPSLITPIEGGATTTVYEAGLPARGGEPEGSGEAAAPGVDGDPREAVSGTVTFHSADGIQSLTVAGVALDPAAFPQTVSSDATGTLVITGGSYDPVTGDGHFDYTYTLTDNTSGDTTSASFAVVLTDDDGDPASSTLTIDIVDDTPTAHDDAASVSEGSTVSGGVLGNDVPGADGFAASPTGVVTGIASINQGTTDTSATAGGDFVLTGQYGTLTLNRDGSYSYQSNGNAVTGTQHDVFQYTVIDADGDHSTAKLDITINDVTLTADNQTQTVFEAALDLAKDDRAGTLNDDLAAGTVTGSDPTSGGETVSGALAVAGATTYTIVGSSAGTYGLIHLNSDGTYTYTLTKPVDNLPHANDGHDTAPAAETFTYQADDGHGNIVTGTIKIDVVDDTPTARADTDSVAAGSFAPENGNVITAAGTTSGPASADTAGADGARVSFSGTIVNGTLDQSTTHTITPGGPSVLIHGQYGDLVLSENGDYTYTRNTDTPGGVQDTFLYVLTDSDGDSSPTTLTISIGDSTPSLLVPAAGGATTTVYEEALPARAGEPQGSSEAAAPGVNDDPREAVSGTVTFHSADGIDTLTVAGVALDPSLFPQTVSSNATGTLVITGGSYDPVTGDGHLDYTYTLTDNTSGNGTNASFDIVLTDDDGDHANSTLTIDIINDKPTAHDDTASVDEGSTVIGGVLGNDVPGADGFAASPTGAVTGIASVNQGTTDTSATAGGDFVLAGQFGTLTLNQDGSYSYHSNSNSVTTTEHDVFQYTVIDGDGDTSTATLDITINNVALGADNQTQTVFEAALDLTQDDRAGTLNDDLAAGTVTGSDPTSGGETVSGALNVPSATTYTIVGSSTGNYGLIHLNSDGTYTYTLTKPVDNLPHANDGHDTAPAAETFTYQADDGHGNTVTGTIKINIIDDTPNAVDDGITHVAEDAVGTIGGNVVTNDTQGADHATVTSVTIGGVAHAVAAVGTTSVSTANGDYTFKADGTWTFDPHPGLNQTAGPVDASFTYTLTDGDGDQDTASKTILIDDGANPTGGDTLSLTVDDGALSDGNNSASTAEVDAGQLTFTAGSDPLTTFAFGSNLAGLGGGLTWVRVDGNTITGSDGATLIVTLKLTAPASIAAGASGDVTVTATLANNYDSHPVFTADDLQALGSVTVVASDQDGDSATGTVSVSVSDDVPTVNVLGDTTVIEGQTATGTWTESVGADSPGTTKVVFNGTEYDLGTAIDTGKGTLTVAANGTWSFVANNNLDNSVAQSITFSVKVTDVDHDVATDPQTVTITDGAGPIGGDTLSLLVDDGALSFGNNPASTAEVDSGQLTFTAGSDALTSFAFGSSLAGLDPSLTWVRVDNTTITGSDGANLVVTLKLTAPASIAAGASGDVTVTATLSDNYAHHPGAGDDTFAFGSVTVVAADQDGDSATGTVTVSVSDDVPVAVTADAVSVNNVATGSAYAYLDTDHNVANNYGADGAGAVIFTAATITTLQGENLTSGLASLDYAITNGGTTLTATKSTDHSVVFTIDLQPSGHDNQYHVTMSQPLDSLQTVDFNNGGYNFVGGNGSWAGFTQPGDNNSQDLLLSPVGGGTVNTNANEGGVGSGNSVGGGEAMRVDYVIDLNGSPVSGGNFNGGDNTQTFDGHYTVNGGSAFFTHTTNSNVHIAAFDDNDSGTLKNVGDGTPDTVNKIAISYNAGTSVITSNGTYSVGGHSFTVTFNANGTVNVSGVADGTRIAAYTTDGYNSVEWGYTSGDTFKIGDFGATVISHDPVPFTVPISITDGDGDTVGSGNLAITANPVTPPVALDLNGDGIDFLGLGAGVTHDYGHGLVGTAWVGAEDGLLAHNTGSGLDLVFTDDAAGAQTDLQGLALAYDSNHDGQLTSADTAWSSFGVWQDANSNGVADAGEFKTLDQAGIASISLAANGTGYTAAGGDVTVVGTGSYTRTDGSSATLADTVFATATQKIGQQTTEFAAAAAALGGFIGVPVAQAAVAAPMAQPATVNVSDVFGSQTAPAANDVEHTYKAVSAASVELTSPHAEPAAQPATALAMHEEDTSHQAVLPQVTDNAGPAPQPAEHAAPAAEAAAPAPVQGPSDIALMDALLAMQHPAQSAPASEPATVQVAANAGTETTQDLPAVAAVLHDALAGQVVDHILDKVTGTPSASPAIVSVATLDPQGAAATAAGGAAAHAPVALDVHLDAQAGDHAALFAMAAMPTVEEHLVAVA